MQQNFHICMEFRESEGLLSMINCVVKTRDIVSRGRKKRLWQYLGEWRLNDVRTRGMRSTGSRCAQCSEEPAAAPRRFSAGYECGETKRGDSQECYSLMYGVSHSQGISKLHETFLYTFFLEIPNSRLY